MILPLNGKENELSITMILKKNPNKKMVQVIKHEAEKFAMHNTGIKFDKYIGELDYFEKEALKTLRQRYAPTNVDTCGRLHRPLDKIYTAKGGNNNYYLPEPKKNEFISHLANVKDGDSLRAWMQKYWFNAVHYDPMGLVFMEIDTNGNTYPTYKCSEYVYDYPRPKGRKFDYVVFHMPERTEQEKLKTEYPSAVSFYRVVDDTNDYTIKWDGQTAEIIQDESYPNYWGEVPAITLGWIFDNIKKWFVSPDYQIENALDQYMRERSVATMFRIHHGFPLKFQMAMTCPTCAGLGRVKGDVCSSCKGSGNKSKNDVAETIYVKPPRNKDQPVFRKDEIAGYIAPPVESLKAMEENIDKMYRDMHFTTWGTHQIDDSQTQSTATGRFIDVQPVNDRLIDYSKAAEFVEMWVTDMMGRWYYEAEYKGCTVNLGRRYMIETPDQILQRYSELRKRGASLGVLNATYIQYLETEWQNNDIEFKKKMMLFRLEPFPHMTNIEVFALQLPEEEYFKKLYFQQWVNQLKESDLLLKPYQKLFDMLEEYIDSLELEMLDVNEAEIDKSGNVPDKKVRKTQYTAPVNNKSKLNANKSKSAENIK
jgi:hypothetical protein